MTLFAALAIIAAICALWPDPPGPTHARILAPHPRAGRTYPIVGTHRSGAVTVRVAPGHVAIVPRGEWEPTATRTHGAA